MKSPKKHDNLCIHCGTPSSKSPRGKEMKAMQESRAAQDQIRAQREAQRPPMSPMMPMGRPPMPPQGMRPPMGQPMAPRPQMAPPPQGGPVRPGAADPRAALLRAIMAQAQRGQR